MKQNKEVVMTFNPASEPRNERNREQQQQRVDQEYARQIANSQPVVGTYNVPGGTGVQVGNTNVNTEVVVPRDRVRWGPILAGLVSALATLLVLSLLGVAIGLTAAAGDPNGGANAATRVANNYGVGAAIWAAISTLLAFFIGGFVSARSAAVRGKSTGWVNGALVWAVALPVILWLATNGASGFLNAVGFNLSGVLDAVNPANPSSPANPSNPANPANNPSIVQNATETARNGAWGGLGALLLGLVAAGLGGLLGGRTSDEDENIVAASR